MFCYSLKTELSSSADPSERNTRIPYSDHLDIVKTINNADLSFQSCSFISRGSFGSVYNLPNNKVVKLFSGACFSWDYRRKKIDQSNAINELVLGTPFNGDDFVAPEYALIVHKNNRLINALIVIAFAILSEKALAKIKNKKLSLGLKRGLMFFNKLYLMVELSYIFMQKEFSLKQHKITHSGQILRGKTPSTHMALVDRWHFLKERYYGPESKFQFNEGKDGLVIGTIMENQGESLDGYLKKNESGKTNYELRARAVYQVAGALIRSKVIHRDLKPQNILIDHKEKHRPCDLASLASLATNRGPIGTTECLTTRCYAAPEVDNYPFMNKYSEKSDVYALGVILCPELRRMGNHEGWPDIESWPDIEKRRSKLVSNLPKKDEYTPDDKIKGLGLKMTELNPEKRPTMKKVKEQLNLILGDNPEKRPTMEEVIEQLNLIEELYAQNHAQNQQS